MGSIYRACGARQATPAPVGGGFRLPVGPPANAPICRPRKFGQFGGNLAGPHGAESFSSLKFVYRMLEKPTTPPNPLWPWTGGA